MGWRDGWNGSWRENEIPRSMLELCEAKVVKR